MAVITHMLSSSCDVIFTSGSLGEPVFIIADSMTRSSQRHLSGDNLLSTPKVSWSFSNSNLQHLWDSLDSDLLLVPETLCSSSYSKPLPAISNTTMHSFHPSTSPNTSSKGCSETPTTSEVNLRPLPTPHPPIQPPLRCPQDTLRVVVEMEWLPQHLILRV